MGTFLTVSVIVIVFLILMTILGSYRKYFLFILFILFIWFECSNSNNEDDNASSEDIQTEDVQSETRDNFFSNSNTPLTSKYKSDLDAYSRAFQNQTKDGSAQDNPSNNYYTNDNYKYEYREGESPSYSYNYDVYGYDSYGNYVSGNIDIRDNYGEGYIYDIDGNEIYIDVSWIDYGKLEGVDFNLNYYELYVE